MAQIQVAVRCRPFTIDDDLGVKLTKTGEGQGETEVIGKRERKIFFFMLSLSKRSSFTFFTFF